MRRRLPYNLGPMSDLNPPSISKWPFFLGDLILVCFAGFIVYQQSAPMGLWHSALVFAAVGLAAGIGIIPFLREHTAAMKLSEADALATTVAQIQNLEQINTQIGRATTHWQAVQEHSTETVAAAREIGEKMQGELDEFKAFLRKASDAERTHLRLEVEKLRRGENDWLQVIVLMLDHVFALHEATVRAGQPGPIAQLNKFQFACQDAARRMGVLAFVPKAGDGFDSEVHQLAESEDAPGSPAQIAEVLAVGFTYQGRLVRRALVTAVARAQSGPEPEAQAEVQEAAVAEASADEQSPQAGA
jgi:molecular chaperone GrpE (heat shock protein)